MKLTAKIQPSSRTRALATGIALVGAVATGKPLALALLLVTCIGILFVHGKARLYFRFLLRFWLPMAVGLCVVWGFFVHGDPENGYGAGTEYGLRFGGMVSLRIAALAAIFQAAVLSLEGLHLASFLREVGFSPNSTAALISIFNLWPGFARRADQVVAARCARGLMTDRRTWTRVRQFPWVLRTLFVGSLGSSLDRAHRWEAEGLPQRLAETLENQRNPESFQLAGVVWCGIAISWTTASLWPR